MLDLPPCAYEISEYYQVPIELIAGVRLQEAGKLGQRNGPRFNGSYDIGPMQINTWWFKKHDGRLQKFGITEKSVQFNYCQNVAAGTWILKQELDRYKDLDKALSAYNSGKPKENGYSEKVRRKINDLIDPTFNYSP